MLRIKETVKAEYPKKIGMMWANCQNFFKSYVSVRLFPTSEIAAIENPVIAGIKKGVKEGNRYKYLRATEIKTMRKR